MAEKQKIWVLFFSASVISRTLWFWMGCRCATHEISLIKTGKVPIISDYEDKTSNQILSRNIRLSYLEVLLLFNIIVFYTFFLICQSKQTREFNIAYPRHFFVTGVSQLLGPEPKVDHKTVLRVQSKKQQQIALLWGFYFEKPCIRRWDFCQMRFKTLIQYLPIQYQMRCYESGYLSVSLL